MRIFIITLAITFNSFALQAQQSIDTLYANDQKNVALFFPKPIRQGITGASHFVFTYNREKEQHFGLLQAKPGTESNLLVVTNDGKVYSYILKYARELPILNRFIWEHESIGNGVPNPDPTMEVPRIDTLGMQKKAYFKRASEYLLKSDYPPLATTIKKRMKLQLEKMAYDGNETYLVVKVRNASGINFDIDYCHIYVVNGNRTKKASHQRTGLRPLYVHDMPESIMDGLYKRFVFVMPKFVLGDREHLEIESRERNGSRVVVLSSDIQSNK
ncbi:conjugative transposon protein TraN [Muricauda oceani]|uniref:DUF4138 domain-containing protein n=1 Tax=Flagellimonas oceani TaxID=2698672 RepID=A0A6G7J091_9FLAO|nr:DUF4138 domain-containing protein [Allomuricauda oceani]MBW8244827.1 conjugative transposon protein TraN [Allomuricauda oceani]QII43862.1 DUF4138 domain-containing protein [Allomuricauda oceani]